MIRPDRSAMADRSAAIAACEMNGGHHPIPGAGGVSVAHALYEERCSRCPATRDGMKLFIPQDSEIVWTEWGDPYIRHPLADLDHG